MPIPIAMGNRQNWSEEETIKALYIYRKMDFADISESNTYVINLSRNLKRTPSAVKMKLSNLLRLDPDYTSKGNVGLTHGSKVEEAVWKRFADDPDGLTSEYLKISDSDKDDKFFLEEGEIEIPYGDFYTITRKQRVKQSFFRGAVLNAYGNRCCITGVDFPKLLVASHIKPWSKSDPEGERLDPHNGLCLNALHDRAFDTGLITIGTDYRVILSKRLRMRLSENIFKEFFEEYEECKISLPSRYAPKKDYIEYHNAEVFDKFS